MFITGATRKDPWLGYFRLDDMLQAFLAAPAADGRLNCVVIESVVGASVGKSCVDVVDPATYDGASGRHDARCRTFREAFRACAVAWDVYGHRHWRTFDIQTLQDCHSDFRVLRMPEWVEQRIVEEQLAAHYAQQAESTSDTSSDVDDDATIPF